jgi:hypothetical protein
MATTVLILARRKLRLQERPRELDPDGGSVFGTVGSTLAFVTGGCSRSEDDGNAGIARD